MPFCISLAVMKLKVKANDYYSYDTSVSFFFFVLPFLFTSHYMTRAERDEENLIDLHVQVKKESEISLSNA